MGTKRIYEIQRASEVTPDDVFLVERPDGSGGYATYSATGRQIAQGLARAADPGPAPAYADPAYATAEIPFTCLDGGRTLSAPSDATVFGGAGWDEGQFLDSFCVRYPGDEEFSRLQWAKPVPGGGYALDVPRGTEISCPGSVGWGGAAYIRAAAWALEAGGRAPLLSFRLSSDGSAQYAHSPAASFAAAPGLSVRARILVEGEDGGEWRYRLLLQASNSAGRDLPVSVPPSCLVSRRGEWAAPDEDDQS